MERNRELFEKIAAQIEETPHLWDQDVFATDGVSDCGTVMCVAGWATHFTCGLKEGQFGDLVPANGRLWTSHAEEVLGITQREGNALFYGPWDAECNDPHEAAEFLRAVGRGAKFDAQGLVEEQG